MPLERGDRARAMEAIDDLHALDIAVERLVDALPASDDPRHAEVRQSLQREKMAVAFEKARAGERYQRAGARFAARLSRDHPPRGESDEQEPVADWPPARSPNGAARTAPWSRAVLLLTIIAATLAIMFSGALGRTVSQAGFAAIPAGQLSS